MKLFQVYVGGGRFLVRAHDEASAIALARKGAEDYFPTAEDAQKAPAGINLPLDHEGDPEVLDVDFS